jgi:CheY-specific phosphatase CheX
MTPLTESLLNEVVVQVLEECAFLSTEPSPGAVGWQGDVPCITVDFSGPQKGHLELHADKDLAMTIAADMLGVDASDPDARRLADGALAELANVVTGALVARLFGTGCLVELGIPSIAHRPPAARTDGWCGLTLVDLEGRAIDVGVNLEPLP